MSNQAKVKPEHERRSRSLDRPGRCMKRYRCMCVDKVSGMEFEFDLESTTKREAEEEAHCKYRWVRKVWLERIAPTRLIDEMQLKQK
jgi:hypothetical protein